MDAYEKKPYYRVGGKGQNNFGTVLKGKASLRKALYLEHEHRDVEIIEYRLTEVARYSKVDWLEANKKK